MKYLDFKTNADAGGADDTAIQPLVDGEAVDASVLNRPSHNLHHRSDLLLREVSDLRAALVNDVRIAPITISGGVADLSWKGSLGLKGLEYTVGVTPTDANNTSSGAFILTREADSLIISRTIVTPIDRPPTAFFNAHMFKVVFGSSTDFYAAEHVRVILTPTLLTTNEATATWSRQSVLVPATQPSSVENPGALDSYTDTLTLAVSANGTTTLSTINTALAGAPHSVFGTAEVALIDAASIMDLASVTISPVSTVTARVEGAVVSTPFTLSKATLSSFFDEGLLSAPITDITTSGTVDVVTTITVDDVSLLEDGYFVYLVNCDADAYEEVQIFNRNLLANTFQCRVTGSYSNLNSLVVRAPNRMLPGDTLVADIGSARAWGVDPTADRTLSSADLHLVRNGRSTGVLDRHDSTDVIVIARVVPTSPDTHGDGAGVLEFNQVYIEPFGSYSGSLGDKAALAGDLLGPDSSATVPRVVWAVSPDLGGSEGFAGTVCVVNNQSRNTLARVVDTNPSLEGYANGLTRHTSGTLTLGANANDTRVDVSRPGILTNVKGSLTVDEATTLTGTSTINGTMTFAVAPVFSTDLTTTNALTAKQITLTSVTGLTGTEAVILSGNAKQTLLKTGAGALEVGTRHAGDLQLLTNGTTRVTVSSTGTVNFGGNAVTGLNTATPVNAGDAVPFSYMSTFKTLANTWSGTQTLTGGLTITNTNPQFNTAGVSFGYAGDTWISKDSASGHLVINNQNANSKVALYTQGVNRFEVTSTAVTSTVYQRGPGTIIAALVVDANGNAQTGFFASSARASQGSYIITVTPEGAQNLGTWTVPFVTRIYDGSEAPGGDNATTLSPSVYYMDGWPTAPRYNVRTRAGDANNNTQFVSTYQDRPFAFMLVRVG